MVTSAPSVSHPAATIVSHIETNPARGGILIERSINSGAAPATAPILEARESAGVRWMARHSRFDILFEPVRIGPVTAPNRFYAVPHASGMTNTMPRMRAGFREMKAQGGWGVVCTG